jgi:hypothetical protein
VLFRSLKIAKVSDSKLFGGNLTTAHQFLKDKNYEYIIVGSRCMVYGINQTVFAQKINEMDRSDLFDVKFNLGSERVYKIR